MWITMCSRPGHHWRQYSVVLCLQSAIVYPKEDNCDFYIFLRSDQHSWLQTFVPRTCILTLYHFPTVSAVVTSVAATLLPLYTDWPGSWVEVVAAFWLTSAFIADLTITFTLVWDLVSLLSAPSPLPWVLISPINRAGGKRDTAPLTTL